MAINVGVGEQKTQTGRAFPKIIQVIGKGWIVEIHKHPIIKGKFIGIHRAGKFAGRISLDFNLDEYCVDYNEPITLQNA